MLLTETIKDILLSACSIVVTGLLGWGVTVLSSWLNTKIKDKKLASYLTRITQITTDAVECVFQSFVETLKNNDKFDQNAQKEAKDKALEIINSQLTDELKDFIADNYGDIQKWLLNKIESVIYQLKK